MESFACSRCGYKSLRKHHFRRHLRRKYPCSPKLEDIPVEDILRKHFGYKPKVENVAWMEVDPKLDPPDNPTVGKKKEIITSGLYIMWNHAMVDAGNNMYYKLGRTSSRKNRINSYANQYKVSINDIKFLYEVEVANEKLAEKLIFNILEDFRVDRGELFKIPFELAKQALDDVASIIMNYKFYKLSELEQENIDVLMNFDASAEEEKEEGGSQIASTFSYLRTLIKGDFEIIKAAQGKKKTYQKKIYAKYSCERCMKEFSQKSFFDKHVKQKNPCQDSQSKIIEVVEKNINKKLNGNEKYKKTKEETLFTIELRRSDEVGPGASRPPNGQRPRSSGAGGDRYEKEEQYLSSFLSTIKKKIIAPRSFEATPDERGSARFKRVCISPLRYAGGKSKAIGMILDNLPRLKEKKIVSPFFGGGSFELCVSQKLNIEVVGYDIFGLLVNFWNVLINDKEAFIQELKKFKIDKDEFTYNRHLLLNYWDKIKPKDLNYKTMKKVELDESDLTLLDSSLLLQAVYYYYNMTLSYGPMFLGWPSSNEINKDKFARRIKKIEHLDLKNLSVDCCDFEEVLKRHQNDFLFLDPPYYLEGDSKMFKGMYPNCNFAIHHNNFNHKKMYELLKYHRGGFFLTYNNCSTLREWYKNYTFEYPEWQYTYGQGETRIGKNRKDANKEDNIKESHEIFIICWPE